MSYSSSDYEFFCAAPVASIATESLWAIMDHPVKGRSMVKCDLPVTWLRKCICTVVFCHGGQDVRELAKVNDYYGFCQSIEDSVVKALEHCRTYRITRASSACIEVRLTVQDEPALFSDTQRAREVRAKNADRPGASQSWWLEFPFDKFRCRVEAEPNPEQPGQIFWRYPYLEARPVAERMVWSSRELSEQAEGLENDKAIVAILMAVLKQEFLPVAATRTQQSTA